MGKTLLVRDAIVRALRENDTYKMITADSINGFYFSASDIVLSIEGNKPDAFRVIVIKHGN